MGLKEPGLRGSLRNTSSVLPAFFDVTITNTNSPVQEGDILTVDYSADNTGDAQDMQDIRLEIDSVQEDVDPDVMLAGGASTTGTLEWDTTGEDEAEYTATVLSDDDSDSVMVEIGSAIPDSAIYHLPILERSDDTIVEELQDEDALAVGTTNVSNDWWEGYAEEGDGTDYIEWTTLPDLAELRQNGDFSILFTVDDLTDRGVIFGTRNSANDNNLIILNDDGHFDSDPDVLNLSLRGDSGNTVTVSGSTNITDGGRYRCVVTCTGMDNVGGWQFFVNGSEESMSVENDSGEGDSLSDTLDDEVTILAENFAGSIERFVSGIVDNIIVTDDIVDSTTVEDDYNSQPWS